MIRGVCFDMDGLLFDTERLGVNMMQDAIGLQGGRFTEEQWLSVLGQNLVTTKAAIRRWFGDRIDPDRFFADWCRLMLEHMRRHGMPEKPGARAVLEALRSRGVSTALVTSNDPEVVTEYLEISGFSSYFDHIVTGNMVLRSKPDPDIYLKAAELLGIAPALCAGVEDSVNGVKAIHAAGMRSVMVPDIVPYSAELVPFVDVCIPSLCELESALFEKE